MRTRRVVVLVLVVLAALGLGCHLWAQWEYRAAQQASASHEFKEAQRHLERCLKVWFLSSETYRLAGRSARQAGNFNEAEYYFRTSRALGGSEDALDLEFKLLSVQEGDLAPAEQSLEGLIEQNHPESVAILEVLTPAYLQADRVNNALECIEHWLELDPDSLAAWQYRAQLFGRLQVSTKLLESYRRILELNPENDAVRLQFAGQLIKSRQAQEALEQYKYLRPRLGDTPQVLSGVACCMGDLNQPDEARSLLNEVLAREPHNALALAERGHLSMQYESPAEAEKWLRRALAEGPAEHGVLYSLFQCLQKLGKEKEAAEIQAKFKAIESDLIELREAILQIGATPHDAEARYKAGLILLRNGKDKEGLRWLASALREDPRHAATHRALADYYQRSGDSKGAAQHRAFSP